MSHPQDHCPPEPANPDSVEALYPSGSRPADRLLKLSTVCSFGQTPNAITGALCQLLQYQFADPRNIRSATVRRMVAREGAWRQGNPDNAIFIESIQNWVPELTQSRPAIIIKDGDWNLERKGIGNQLGDDYETGEEAFGAFWYGSHSLFAIGGPGAGGETKALAGEVAKILLQWGQHFANTLELHRFTLVKLGALASLEEAPEHYVCPLDVAYVVSENWTTQIEAPRLKRIEFRPNDMDL